jgi:hypothetical protein
VQIPVFKGTGFPTVSPSMLRTYGASGLILDELEAARGCPRLFKAKYVEKRVPEEDSYALKYGGIFHDVLFLMEEHAIGPDEALARACPADVTPEMYRELLDDLTKYMERAASPADLYHTVDVEVKLDALLYVDEEFGPIHIRGILDHIGIDPEDPGMLHGTDYKTNRSPARDSDLAGDIQLMTYHYLIRENRARFTTHPNPRIVMHLDLIKYRPYEWRFSPADIETFRAWAEAVVRKMLRDTEALPVMNPGCRYCPVAGDCPLIAELPTAAAELLAMEPETREDLHAWREKANAMRLLLAKRVELADIRLKGEALEGGGFVVGGIEYKPVDDKKWRVDLRRLFQAMEFDDFIQVITTSKTAVEKYIKHWPASEYDAVMQAIEQVVNGQKVTTRKAENT